MPRTRAENSPPVTSARPVRWQWWVVLLLIAILVVGSAYAVFRHRDAVGHGTVAFGEIVHTSLPAHVPSSFLNEVQASAAIGAAIELSDEESLRKIRIAFEMHPWVRRVESFDVSTPGRLRVQLQFRTPVAMVQIDRAMMYIDAEGVRLPTPVPAETLLGLLRIDGTISSPQGEPGQRWGAKAVESAAQVAGLVAGDQASLQLVAVEVDLKSLEPVLRLRTAGGTRVIWQTLPDADNSVTAEEKLARLRGYRERNGSLDAPVGGPYLLDVRPPNEIIRQKLRQ
jgi:hypothetical protein